MSFKTLSVMSLMVLVAAASGPAMSEPTGEPKNAVAEQIRAINEKITVLSAQLNEAEMRAKIAAKNEEIRRIGQGSAQEAPGTQSARPQMQVQEEVPSIQSIDGVDGKLKAVLLMRNGGVLPVRQGDRVGTWTVKAINISSVTLTKGKETTTLNFGTLPATQPNAGMSPNASYATPNGNFASSVQPLPVMPTP